MNVPDSVPSVEPMWPVGAPPEYVQARLRLADAEREHGLRARELAAARRALPAGAVLGDYVLREGPADPGLDEPAREVRLVELFGERHTLLLYHLMLGPSDDEACPMCSLWVDGLHGVAHHLARHAAFAVVAKADLPALRAWGRRRGWDGLRLVSSHGTTFNADLAVERPNGEQRPVISVLRRSADGVVRHFYSMPANYLDGTEGAIDTLSPVWGALDLMPDGRGEWYAGNDYAGRSRGPTS